MKNETFNPANSLFIKESPPFSTCNNVEEPDDPPYTVPLDKLSSVNSPVKNWWPYLSNPLFNWDGSPKVVFGADIVWYT